MSRLLTILLVAIVCPVLFAQKNPSQRPAVVWSNEPACSSIKSAEIKGANPACTAAAVEKKSFYLTEYNGITYAISFEQSQDLLVATVQISNNSGGPLTPNPSRSRMERFDSEISFNTGSASTDNYSALSRDKLRRIKYIQDDIPVEEAGIREGLRTKEGLEDKLDKNGSMKGARIQATETPDQKLREDRYSMSLRVTNAVFSNLLQAKVLNDKEKRAGYLVFETSKTKGFYMMFLNVGNIDFAFPIGDAAIRK
jgi:hypothetical protein